MPRRQSQRGRTPRYTLVGIQRLVRERQYRITVAARRGASALYLDESDVLDAVLGLRESHFYKSMQSRTISGLFQDVYRCRYQSRAIYVKLQISRAGDTVIISFKRDESA